MASSSRSPAAGASPGTALNRWSPLRPQRPPGLTHRPCLTMTYLCDCVAVCSVRLNLAEIGSHGSVTLCTIDNALVRAVWILQVKVSARQSSTSTIGIATTRTQWRYRKKRTQRDGKSAPMYAQLGTPKLKYGAPYKDRAAMAF